MRIRRNLKSLSDAEKTNFINAVLGLKNKKSVLHPNDANRSRYDDYAEVHMNAMMHEVDSPNGSVITPGWAHNGPAFFPWHRELILQFENDLAAIDPSVTIPYWDWPDTDPKASPFNNFLGGDGTGPNNKVMDGPFAHDGPNAWTIKVKDSPGDANFLQRAFGSDNTAPSPPGTNLQTSVMQEDTYDASPWKADTHTFRSRCEIELHNRVHRYVGGFVGTMRKMTSPNDPVFFLHHCNIDRLWAHWQRIHTSSSFFLPLSGAQLGHNLDDQLIFNNPGDPAPFNTTATPGDMIDNLALNYTYDDLPVATAKSFNVNVSMTYVQILYGIINDAPGAWIGPDGKIHHVPGGPGDPDWMRVNPNVRDALVARAINEVAGLLSASEVRGNVQKATASLVAKAGKAKISATAGVHQ